MNQIDYKVKNGKLIRITYDLDKVIKKIKIYGDFFIHPEDAIFEIEKALENKRPNQITKTISDLIKNDNIKIIGFEPEDIEKIICEN